MKLRVNPNRMQLLKLKKREVIAKRGHSLLQDKLEKLLISAHKTIKELNGIFKQYLQEVDYFLKDFIIFRAQVSKDFYENLVKDVGSLQIEEKREQVFNLVLSSFTFELSDKEYLLENSSGSWDRVYLRRRVVLDRLFKLIELYRKLEVISEELKRTRRRVNALEYILIPAISQAISHIEEKLEEIEREFISSLLRIKDIIRKG
ncbi:MAG: V-type ATP synthase subunit D [Candidatus Omnitrophica bacterium]|nr:V-type ATP synthase subunit D [Candidatus Omnitrophota bacterium]